MMNKLRILALIALIPFSLISCKGEEAPQQQAVKKPKPAQAAPAHVAPRIDTAAGIEGSVEVKRRNPFQSYLMLVRTSQGVKKVKGPLECCELNAFRILAVVAGAENSAALIQAPDGKRYVVKEGDGMGIRDGRVIKVYSKGITVREESMDEEGKVIAKTDTDIKLPQKEVPLFR